MDSRLKQRVWRGVVACVAMGLLPVVVGCVSRSAYEAEVEKNEHLRYIKTEQDIERDGLHADVGALRRAYSDQSLRTTFLEGLAQQMTKELNGINTKLTSLSQDIRQQQGDQVRATTQGTETVRLLESLAARQEETRAALQSMAAKIEGVKKVIGTRPGEIPTSKGAAQRALDQKLLLNPASAEPVDLSNGVGGDKKHMAGSQGEAGEGKRPLGSEKDPAVSSISPSAVLSASAPPVAAIDQAVADGAGGVDQEPSPKNGESRTVSQKDADKGEASPLITSTVSPKPTGEGKPVERSWGDWASGKWNAVKAKVTGTKPVQTAAEGSSSSSSAGKK